jgi:AraC-like DNA-binding protein
MLNFEEKIILQDYKKALKGYYKDKVIDLDKGLDKKLDCFLIRVEKILSELGTDIPPYQQSKYTILYIVKGNGKKMIGTVIVPVKDRTLMVIQSRTINSSHYKKVSRGYNLSFNLKFFLQEQFPKHHLVKMNLFNPGLMPYSYPNASMGKYLTEIFETILNELEHYRKNREDLIALKTLELIILCDRQFKIEKKFVTEYHPPLLVQYIDLIQEQFKNHHSTSYYAKKLHVHPNSLNATSKRYLGQTAKTIVDEKLLLESKYLLHQTTLSVKEIAYELGFNSPSNFFRFFKRHAGQSPARFRHKSFEYVAN